MNIEEKLIKPLADRIKEKKGLDNFFQYRSKFEGWLKVEVVDILLGLGFRNVQPEKGLIDIYSEEMLIELKVLPTNYNFEGKARNITDVKRSIINDYQRLQNNKSLPATKERIILFVLFPYFDDWGERIKEHLDRMELGYSTLIGETKEVNSTPFELERKQFSKGDQKFLICWSE